MWLLSEDGNPRSLYLDASDIVKTIKLWAETCYRCAGDEGLTRALRTLVVSGPA